MIDSFSTLSYDRWPLHTLPRDAHSAPCRAAAQPARYSFDDAQAFLKGNCQLCHQGTAPAGGFDIHHMDSPATIRSESARWNTLALRVHNGEMPPRGALAPSIDQREQFTHWVTILREVLRRRHHPRPFAHPPPQSR